MTVSVCIDDTLVVGGKTKAHWDDWAGGRSPMEMNNMDLFSSSHPCRLMGRGRCQHKCWYVGFQNTPVCIWRHIIPAQPEPCREFIVLWIWGYKETICMLDNWWWQIIAIDLQKEKGSIFKEFFLCIKEYSQTVEKILLMEICRGPFACEWLLDLVWLLGLNVSFLMSIGVIVKLNQIWCINIGLWPKTPFLLIVTWKPVLILSPL